MSNCVDNETLSMLKEVMEDEFALLLNTFIDDGQARIPQLRQQLAAGIADELRRNAHSLKGSSSNIGATRLSDICMKLEDSAKDGNLTGLDSLIDELESEFSSVKAALQTYL